MDNSFDWTVSNPAPTATVDTGAVIEDDATTTASGNAITDAVADSDPDGDDLDITDITFPGTTKTDGGTTFNAVPSVDPAYFLTIDGQDAWGGDASGEGWQSYTADLSSFAGQDVILRFSFRSDSSIADPGVYIDNVVVAEPLAIPLEITSPTIADGLAGVPYDSAIARDGGSPTAQWSIVGGTNQSDQTLASHIGERGLRRSGVACRRSRFGDLDRLT